MTKREFLEKLRAALAEDLGSAAVQEQKSRAGRGSGQRGGAGAGCFLPAVY